MSATPAPVPFPYAVTGFGLELGAIVPIGDWAARARVPHRQRPGTHLAGADVERILGIAGKSWDRARFSGLAPVVAAARAALAQSGTAARELDCVVVVTCTPHQVMFDQDCMALLRALEVPDEVPPLQLGAGCAGLARAARVVARQRADRALVVAYNLASAHTTDADGALLPPYRENTVHPYGAALWASPALFSDAAAALVLRRDGNADGVVLYSRDSRSFGGGQPVEDPLIHYPGGGAAAPPGTPEAAGLACYGMNAPAIRGYYAAGMMLNHAALDHAVPGYLGRVRRLYTHQANPALVAEVTARLGVGPGTAPHNVTRYGNLVSPSTVALLQEDWDSGAVGHDDLVCFSVVGAGPERGAFIVPVRIPAQRDAAGAAQEEKKVPPQRAGRNVRSS